MGGVKDFLFGKKPKPETSSSGNYAWDPIKSAFTPALGYTTQGGDMLANLLGLSGGPAQTAGLENFASSGGMDFLREQGNRQITSNKAASGLLGSGSFGTALEKYGQGLGSTYLNQYMDNLLKLSNLGIQSGGVMAGAGQHSTGTGATQGKAGALPSIIQGAAMIPGISDIRLKRNIKQIGQTKDGLGIYDYELVFEPGVTRRGVMAHEVRVVRPYAYIENIVGEYAGVDYGKLGSLEGVRD